MDLFCGVRYWADELGIMGDGATLGYVALSRQSHLYATVASVTIVDAAPTMYRRNATAKAIFG